MITSRDLDLCLVDLLRVRQVRGVQIVSLYSVETRVAILHDELLLILLAFECSLELSQFILQLLLVHLLLALKAFLNTPIEIENLLRAARLKWTSRAGQHV